MKLHEHKEEFEELIAIVANHIRIPADAVRRDYYRLENNNGIHTGIRAAKKSAAGIVFVQHKSVCCCLSPR